MKNDKANNGFNYTLRLMFMSIFEKLFSKAINVFQDVSVQNQNSIELMKTSIQMIQELHTNIINQSSNSFNPVTFTYQLIAISFIKVYFSTHIRISYNQITSQRKSNYENKYVQTYRNKFQRVQKVTTNKIPIYSNTFLNNFNNFGSIETMKMINYFIYKILRYEFCNSFAELNTIITKLSDRNKWIKNLTFNEMNQMNYEYIFFSKWQDRKYLEKYFEKEQKLREKLSSKENNNDSVIHIFKQYLKTGEIQMLIDILFNIYDNLIKTNNKNKICEWLINLQPSDIFENQIKFLQVVAHFLSQINLKTLSITIHPFFTSLEIILISFKFIFALIINNSNLSKFTHSEL
jgi:hypothetical protein